MKPFQIGSLRWTKAEVIDSGCVRTLIICTEVESSLLFFLVHVLSCLLKADIPVNLGMHLFSESENPRSVTRVWRSFPVLVSEYTFPHAGCVPGLRS